MGVTRDDARRGRARQAAAALCAAALAPHAAGAAPASGWPQAVVTPAERELDALLSIDSRQPAAQRIPRLEVLRLDRRWAAPRWQALIGVHRCAIRPDAAALAALAAGAKRDAQPDLRLAWLKCRQWVADQAGDPVDNYAQAREAWALLDERTPPTLAFRVARDLADEAAYAGMLDEALDATGRALDIARALGDPAREATALQTLAMVQSDLGRHAEALANSDRALALDPDIGRHDAQLIARSAVQLHAGRPADALLTLDKALAVAEAARHDDARIAIQVNIAEALLRMGREREALALTARLLAEAERVDIAYIKPYVWGVRASALVATGQVDAGIALHEQARAWFERGGDVNTVLRDAGAWGRRLADAGRWQQAYAALAQAAELRERTHRAQREKSADLAAAMLESARKDRDIERLRHQAETARLERERGFALVAAVLLSAASLLFVHLRLRRANRSLREVNAALAWESTHDALTRAHNRRYFARYFAERRARGQGRALLVLLDIDHFKSVNDTHGHDAGDRVLQQVAQRLRDSVRAADRVIRWGGEEFLVFFDEPADAEAERTLVLRLLDAVATLPVQLRGDTLPVTASIGFASVTLADGFELDPAISDVDALLYLAKRGGRARAVGRLQGEGREPVVLLPPSGAAATVG